MSENNSSSNSIPRYKTQISINGEVLPVGKITEDKERAESEAMLWREYYKGKSKSYIKIKVEVIELNQKKSI